MPKKRNQYTDTAELIEQIDALYATLPEVKCQRRCQDSCGPVMMSGLEWLRIIDRLGKTPQPQPDLSCPMLSIMGNCSVYDIRPAVCRLYGVTKALQCAHGCVPEQWLDEERAREILNQLHRITKQANPRDLRRRDPPKPQNSQPA